MALSQLLNSFTAFSVWCVLNACSLNAPIPSNMIYQELDDQNRQALLKHLGEEQLTVPSLQLAAHKNRYVYQSGEPMWFSLTANQASHVACYYQPTDGSVVKVFPNRFRTNSQVHARATNTFPNPRFFSMLAGESGKHETLLCLNSPDSFADQLPWAEEDLVPLPVDRLEDIIGQYKKLGGDRLTYQTLKIEVR